MNNSKTYRVVEIIAAIFIFLFAYTAISKLSDHSNFVFILKNSPLLGNWATMLSWLLPVTEFIIVLLLIFPQLRLVGFYLSFGLMTVFTCYIGFMLAYASELPCSCGGILNRLSWKEHWILNIALTILATIGALLEIKRIKSIKSFANT